MTNLYAFTPRGTLPPYISVNLEETGKVSVFIRSESPSEGQAGTTVKFDLTIEQARDLANSILVGVA